MKNTSEKKEKWGTYEWFLSLSKDNPKSASSYYSHGVNGYQLFRHMKLAQFLENNTRNYEFNNIVDIGCGTGHLLDQISKTFNSNECYGIDFITPVIKEAEKNFPSIKFSTSKLPTIPIERASTDLVIASEVIYYLSAQEQMETVNEIYNILKPNGVLFLSSKLGEKYLSTSSSTQLLSEKFHIESISYLHSKLYHKITYFPHKITRLDEFLNKKTTTISSKHNKTLTLFNNVFNNYVGRYFIHILGKTSKTILKSTILPSLSENIAKRISKKFRGNILIIAKRK